MMSVVAASRVRGRHTGVRRLDPSSDLAQVADLIEEAFSDELDREGRDVLREMRRMSRLGLLMWLLRQISPEFGDVLSGFVWEEDGQIVGNTSLNLTSQFPPLWRISNVAVTPAFRRRGIARRLMQEAIDYCRMRGAQVVSLQVRDDNPAAVQLYDSMEFKVVTAETDLMLPAGSMPPSEPLTFAPRAVASEEWPDLYSLVSLATPEEDQRMTPLQKIDFQLDWIQSATEWWNVFVSGRKRYRIVADGRSGLAGYLIATTAPRQGGPHRLMLWAHPRYEGQVERDLLQVGLRTLLAHGVQPVQIKVNPAKKQLVAALLTVGFRKRRTLLTMELPLD